MRFLPIVLLLVAVLVLRHFAARSKRAGLALRTYQRIATQAWEPMPDTENQAETGSDERSPEAAYRITTTPDARRTPLAGFYRTLYGPGLCSPQATDHTTAR